MAVESRQKIENLSTKFRAKVGQSTPKSQKNAKIQTPIFPPNGGRLHPNKNRFSQGRQGYKKPWSDGGAGPKPKNAPNPNFEPTLLEFREFNFHEIFSIVRAPKWLSNAVKKSKICRQTSEKK